MSGPHRRLLLRKSALTGRTFAERKATIAREPSSTEAGSLVLDVVISLSLQ